MAKFEIGDAKGSGIAVFVRFTECDRSIFKSAKWDPDDAVWSATWQPREVIMNWLKEAEEQRIQLDDYCIECLLHALFSPQALSESGLEILEETERVTGLSSYELDWILEELHSWEVVTDGMIADNVLDLPREQALEIIKAVRRFWLARSVQTIRAFSDIEIDLLPSHCPEPVLIN
ncbi:MAG: hypothetical protein QNK42_01410 [Pseudodonghicola sp.]|nr:hypothetical protein [Pseudodonghicola sp.]